MTDDELDQFTQKIVDKTIQAYKETKAFRLAAIEYVIEMEWPGVPKKPAMGYSAKVVAEKMGKAMLEHLQEEIENEV